MLNNKKIIIIIGVIIMLSFGMQSVKAGDDTSFRQDLYNKVEPIKLVDPLSYVLGATNTGEPYIYHYADII